jgi:hypothetical protein
MQSRSIGKFDSNGNSNQQRPSLLGTDEKLLEGMAALTSKDSEGFIVGG